jgi:hypothetical protein
MHHRKPVGRHVAAIRAMALPRNDSTNRCLPGPSSTALQRISPTVVGASDPGSWVISRAQPDEGGASLCRVSTFTGTHRTLGDGRRGGGFPGLAPVPSTGPLEVGPSAPVQGLYSSSAPTFLPMDRLPRYERYERYERLPASPPRQIMRLISRHQDGSGWGRKCGILSFGSFP